MEPVGAKRRLRNFQDVCLSNKCMISGIVHGALELTIELVNEDVSADAGSLN